MRALFRETVDGFIFWSLFQALAPMIWFYPLNDLEISGYEAFAGFWFLPIICGIPGVLPLFQNKWMTLILRLISVGCLSSFQAPSTLSRLIILAAGAGVSMLVFTVQLSHKNKQTCYFYYRSLIFGLFALLSSRIWCLTFIPTWWSNNANSIVIALGVIVSLDLFISHEDVKPTKGVSEDPSKCPNWLFLSLGMGSLLFCTHWCFGEVSIITRWVVKGYPDAGPGPVPWGAPVLVALLVGVFLSDYPGISGSYLWWLVGSGAFAGLYYLPTWQGYGAGLVLGVYILTIWPRLIHSFSKCPPARSAFVTMATYICQVLFSVWTVAYNFVPGGVYTREATNYLILSVMFFILLALIADRHTTELFTGIELCHRQSSKMWLVILVLIGLSGIGYRHKLLSEKLSAPKPSTKQFSSAIWTYHFGYDNRGWPSLERSADFLNKTEADVITLLESDASKTFLGNNDLGTWLGEKLGMYVDFGVSTRDHTWGNLILSKYPIIKSVPHMLPSPHGELAPAITTTVNISGTPVDFVVTHMGNDRDVIDRKLQAEYLAKELRNSDNPVVFMGYVTSAPFSRDYIELIRNGNVKDIDSSDHDRWCEYIMYRGLVRLGYARITHGGLSDTELQMAKFQIPDNKNYKDNSRTETRTKKVDRKILFNSYFGSFFPSHGYFEDHGFHMSTPKYFLP
ncbi:hypothetical protein SNE40_004739 [Patella caerulea]|uniref:PGAP2-interacting protein n=2 Tax=Patella caerulea TaxID=87958 RepID=A0AAN8JYP0_PATCE